MPDEQGPNGSPAPEEAGEQRLPEVDVRSRMCRISLMSTAPIGHPMVIEVNFWKIKQLAAAVLFEESAEEQAKIHERARKVISGKQARRDWREIIGVRKKPS